MDKNLLLIIIIAVIGSGSLFGIFFKMKEGFGPFNLKVYGLTIVVLFSAIITLSEIPVEKLAACFSILGAIAGYLFGLKKD